MKQPLSQPKKDGDVTVYEIEVTEEDFEEPIDVSMQDKETRLVVKLRPMQNLFSV
jgi:hypothetical protein